MHTGVCGPFQTVILGRKSNFVTFIDDFSIFTIVFLLPRKSEVVTKLGVVLLLKKKKIRRRIIKSLQSDNGGD